MDKYDVFISHASEDKEAIARPIAQALSGYGVRVWYDEFSLRLGDSLSRSIDRGLADSKFGLVILSASFFAKNWPEYELRGLTAKEMVEGKVVLPIWHQVEFGDVVKYSPPLADKLAVKSNNKSPDEIALEIIGIIRPDLLSKIHKRIAYLNSVKNTKVEKVEVAKIKLPPLRHKELPPYLISRIRLIRAALLGVYTHSMNYWVDGFRGDAHPSKEIKWWERVASCFTEYVRMTQLNSQESYQSAFEATYGLAMGDKKEDLQDLWKVLPADAYEKISNLLKYQYPIYDINEGFPSMGEEIIGEELEKWLEREDVEDFESLDKEQI